MANIEKYNAGGTEIELNNNIVKQYLVSGDPSKVTDAEVKMFVELCKAQRLNPFLREAYLVKFGSNPAQIIVGKDVFLKRARANPRFKGFKAGIIVETKDGTYQNRPGTFYTPGEKIVGGFCKVAIEGWDFPLEHSVAMSEFSRTTATWKSMPAVMIRKVALVQALREAFPEDFQAMYSEEEMPIDDEALNRDPVVIDDGASEAEAEDIADSEVIDEAETISDAQRKRMFAIAGDERLVRAAMARAGYEHTSDITIDDYDAIIADIEQAKEALEGRIRAYKQDHNSRL